MPDNWMDLVELSIFQAICMSNPMHMPEQNHKIERVFDHNTFCGQHDFLLVCSLSFILSVSFEPAS